MRYLFVLMLVATMITACKKESDTNALEAPKAASITAAAIPTAQNKAVKPILTQSVFTCEDKTSFTAQFKSDEMNIVSGKNPIVILPQQITASGFWYKNAQYELRGKGREATLTIAGRKPVKCSAQ